MTNHPNYHVVRTVLSSFKVTIYHEAYPTDRSLLSNYKDYRIIRTAFPRLPTYHISFRIHVPEFTTADFNIFYLISLTNTTTTKPYSQNYKLRHLLMQNEKKKKYIYIYRYILVRKVLPA